MTAAALAATSHLRAAAGHVTVREMVDIRWMMRVQANGIQGNAEHFDSLTAPIAPYLDTRCVERGETLRQMYQRHVCRQRRLEDT